MSLKSAGYDAVILINERFLNQFSGALFYNGFLRINRDIDVIDILEPEARAKIDPSLYPFFKLHFRLHLLHEPSIDFLESDDPATPFKMRLFFDLRMLITIWNGLELPMTARLSLITGCGIKQIPEDITEIEPNSILNKIESKYLEPGSQMLLLDLAECELETFTVAFGDQKLKSLSIDLDKLLMAAVRANFAENGGCFAMALPSFGSYLPGLKKLPENRLYVEIVQCRVIDSETLAIAFNLMGYKGGSPEGLYNFARNCSAGIALPEVTIQKILDFGWEKLMKDKKYAGEKSFQSDKVNEFIDKVGKVFDIAGRISVELASLGFVEADVNIHGIKFVVGYEAQFPWKPAIDLMPGNKVRLTNARTKGLLYLKVLLDVEAKVEYDPTGWLPDFIPDIEVYHERRDVEIFGMRLRLDDVGLKEASGKVIFNELTNTFAISLESLDLALDTAVSLFTGCPFLSFPDWIQEKVLNFAELIIVECCPTVSIVPPLTFNIPGIPWPMNIKGKKLDMQADELTATLDAWFEPLRQDIPYVPKYIVNTNNGEIHYLGCSSLLDTYEEHQKGFHLLNDAINRGFDGCGRCLEIYNTH